MTKTIEEAAREYANNAYYPAPDYDWDKSDDEQMKEVLADTFKAGATHIMSLPLASRMTAGEKERVRRTLNMYYGKWREHPNEATEGVYCTVKEIFESMFGADFFKEESK